MVERHHAPNKRLQLFLSLRRFQWQKLGRFLLDGASGHVSKLRIDCERNLFDIAANDRRDFPSYTVSACDAELSHFDRPLRFKNTKRGTELINDGVFQYENSGSWGREDGTRGGI